MNFVQEKKMDSAICINMHKEHENHEIIGYRIFHNPLYDRVQKSFWRRFVCHLFWPLSCCLCVFSCCDTFQEPIYLHKENCEQCIKEKSNKI